MDEEKKVKEEEAKVKKYGLVYQGREKKKRHNKKNRQISPEATEARNLEAV